jgi:cytochrome P450
MDRFVARDDASMPPDTIHVDILGKLFQLQSEKSVLTDPWVKNMSMTNFGAGVDTTSATVSILIDIIVRYPGSQERVNREIDSARREGTLSSPPKLGEMKQHLPFLNACLKESIHLAPVVGMPLMREFPKTGLELEGYYLPAGVRTP